MENHVLMLPDVQVDAINDEVNISDSTINGRDLLINSLYWDKIIVTKQPLIGDSNENLYGFKELSEAGLIQVVDFTSIPFNGSFSKHIYDVNMKFIFDSYKRKDVNFSTKNADAVLLGNKHYVLPENGELVTLVNAIPEPDKSVNVNDIIKFREKRKDELNYLMIKLNSLNVRIMQSENKYAELKASINEIDKSCADVIRLYNESRIKFNLSTFSFNSNLPEAVAGAEAVYKLAKYIGLPETVSVISGIVSGVTSLVEFKPSFSLRKIDKSNPFNYVGEMSVKLN